MRWRDIAMIGVWLLTACRPERPVTSSIIIDLEKPTQPVQEALYGVTLEEMNHAVEGGIYAEMIRNRSLEDGAVPYGCLYDAARNVLVTPAGWEIPFVSPYTIPGWRPLSSNTLLTIDTHDPLNEDNHPQHNPHPSCHPSLQESLRFCFVRAPHSYVPQFCFAQRR